MKNTMRKAFLFLALALIVAGGAFAQRVGDTWQVGDETWVVQSVSGDMMTMRKAPGLNGLWKNSASDEIMSISGTTAVWTVYKPTNALWIDAGSKGYLKDGSQVYRNLTKTGDLTWSGEKINVTGSGRNATGTNWVRLTLTMSADGQTIRQNDGTTWTRR